MRRGSIVALFVAALAVSNSDAMAEPYYPWCARYNGWTIVCSFVTFQQCMATISGVGGICQQNVLPPPIVERRVARKRKHRR